MVVSASNKNRADDKSCLSDLNDVSSQYKLSFFVAIISGLVVILLIVKVVGSH